MQSLSDLRKRHCVGVFDCVCDILFSSVCLCVCVCLCEFICDIRLLKFFCLCVCER